MSNVVEMGKKYNLYSWSAQSKINPINIVKTEGIYFWEDVYKRQFSAFAESETLRRPDSLQIKACPCYGPPFSL